MAKTQGEGPSARDKRNARAAAQRVTIRETGTHKGGDPQLAKERREAATLKASKAKRKK